MNNTPETCIVELRGGPLDGQFKILKGEEPPRYLRFQQFEPAQLRLETENIVCLEFSQVEYGYSHKTPTGIYIFKIMEDT